ncbi:tetratricopeptide repeat protein [Flavobacterium sp.]|uniref:tetratricopeptide repeat protein n=1 Tax=Flavobacterium sp. TaxID=239 RepID=UPI00262CF119|nr:tetratricopeptide repeat protein [Flavobacterium sp.]
MKLFGFLKKNKENDTFRISELDKLWIEDNFRWLIKVFGYPYYENEQILLSENYFPNSFSVSKVLIENIIKDLCFLFQIQEDKLSFEVVKDIRDSYHTPYEIEGKPFETTVRIEEGNYKIYIANSLQNNPKRLIYSLVYDFIKIKLTDNKLEYDTADDTDLFIYLAGIYFGFGVLLSHSLKDIGSVNDGYWVTKWNYISEMPTEVMAFALATYSNLIEQDAPKWIDQLPSDLKSQFRKAIKYLKDNPNDLYDKRELQSNELFKAASERYLENDFEEAITLLQNVLFLTKNDVMKAEVYNNLGYIAIRLKNYEQASSYFKSSLRIIPNYGYANDNLGYALIQLGQLDEGRSFLEKALQTENNDPAYTYRNFALYHQAKGEMKKAEEYFRKSFESITQSVDLLEYHYAEFLIMNGDKEKGLEFLKLAAQKGEHEAIEKLNKIEKNEG